MIFFHTTQQYCQAFFEQLGLCFLNVSTSHGFLNFYKNLKLKLQLCLMCCVSLETQSTIVCHVLCESKSNTSDRCLGFFLCCQTALLSVTVPVSFPARMFRLSGVARVMVLFRCCVFLLGRPRHCSVIETVVYLNWWYCFTV